MAEETPTTKSGGNDAKNIIKNLGNLNKVIIGALIDAQKLDPKAQAPSSIDPKIISTHLTTFSALIGDGGALKSIITNLNGLNVQSNSAEVIATITSSKQIVNNIGRLIDAIKPVTEKINDQTLSLTDIKDKVVTTLDNIKDTLDNFEGDDHKGLLSYFKVDSGDPDAKKRINEITGSLNSVKGLVNGLIKSYTKIGEIQGIPEADVVNVKAAISNITDEKTGIIASTIQTLSDVRKALISNSNLDNEFFKFFLDDKAAKIDAEGPTYVKSFISEIVTDGAGNETLKSIQKQYLKSSSPFGSTITQIKSALTTLKQTKGVADTYAKLFGKDHNETIKSINNFYTNTNGIYQVWGSIFGKNSATEKIVNSLETASEFDPVISADLLKPGKKENDENASSIAPWAENINKVKDAIGTVKGIKRIFDSYITIFADSSGRPTTTGRIKHWQNAINPIIDRWGIIFGKDSLTEGIVDAINDAGNWQPGIPDAFDKAKGKDGKTPFANTIDNINGAVKEIAKIRTIVDSFVGSFAIKPVYEDKEKTILKSAAVSGPDNITNMKSRVDDMKNSLDRDVFGNTGLMGTILGVLDDIGTTSASWKLDGDLFAQEGTNETVFATRINKVKDAVKAIGKISDIFKEVVKTEKKVTETIIGNTDTKSFYDAYDGLDAIINASDNPIAFSLSLCYDVEEMINKLIGDSKFVALNNRAQKDEKGNPWADQIAQTTGILKAIGNLTKIPNQVQKTAESFDKMDSVKNIKSLIEDIKRQTKQVLDDVGDGLGDINEIVISSGINKMDKDTAESLSITNTILGSISDLVNTIVSAGERMEEFGYRRLVHASIQIEFFIEILSNSLEELADASTDLIANVPKNKITAKKLEAALDPVADTYEVLQKMFGIIDETKIMPNPLLKLKAKLMKTRIRNGIIIMNGILAELQTDIQAITPSDKEKLEQFDDILEPIKNIFELIDVINKTPLPNMVLFKLRARRLRRRVLLVAELMTQLQAEIQNLSNSKSTDTKAVRKVQITMNAIKDMMDVFNTIAGISIKLIAKGRFIAPAVRMMIKQFDLFDKLIDRISKLKDTRKANHKLRRMEEIVRSIAILATTMILLVPILALFILVSPVLILGVLVFALVTRVVIMLAKTTASAKTVLLIVAITLIIGAFIVMAAMMLLLVLVVDKLKDGIGTIVAFTLGIIAFMAVLALLGLGVQYVAPFIAMAVLGIVLVTVAVGAILIMAICLKLLEFINLDTDLIKDNVKVVIDTALECMMLAFGPQSDPRGPNQDTSFLDVIGGVIVNIIRALAASIILVLTVISVVAILLIATMLRILATIDKKKLEEGAENAKLAIQTAGEIINSLFGPQDIDKEDGSGNSIFGALLTYVFEPLGKILQAIFAYYYIGIMVIAMGMILLLTTMIRLIANFDSGMIEKGKANAKLAVQAAAEIVVDLFRGDDSDRTPSDRGGLLCVVGYVFGKEFEDIVRAVLAIAYVGVLILAMVMISFLAKQLAVLGELDGGILQKAKENAVLVVKTCVEIMDTIFNGSADADTSEGSSWFKKMLRWVLPEDLFFMINAMVKIGKLALLVIAVGAIGKLAEQLTTLSKFNVSAATAKQKAKAVVDAAGTLVSNLKTLSNGVDASDDDMSKIYDLCTGLSKIPTALQPVANNLMKLNGYKTDDITTAGLTGVKVISTMKQLVEDIDSISCDVDGVNKRLDIIDRISKTVGSFVKVESEDVKNSKDITENYIKFFKQVDSMDLKKLQHTDWLMRSWASISRDLKGDFEGLAKTVNQHIMPMLEKVNETLEKTTKAQQDIINIMSQPVDLNNGLDNATPPSLPPDTQQNNPGTDTTPAPPGGGSTGTTTTTNNTPAPPVTTGNGRGSGNTSMQTGSKTKKYRIEVIDVKEGW